MTHREICIPFMVGGCHFEAVGFLNDSETDINFRVALERTSGEGNLSEEDIFYLKMFLDDLPPSLHRGRKLTHCELRETPGEVRSLIYDNRTGKWCLEGCPPTQRVSGLVLVIRRCKGERGPNLLAEFKMFFGASDFRRAGKILGAVKRNSVAGLDMEEIIMLKIARVRQELSVLYQTPDGIAIKKAEEIDNELRRLREFLCGRD
jgi:hypothetical protein